MTSTEGSATPTSARSARTASPAPNTPTSRRRTADLGSADCLAIAEIVLGAGGESLAKGAGIGLAEPTLAAPRAALPGGPPGRSIGAGS